MNMFNHTIGLVYSNNNPETIVLSFTPTQGMYIKTLPLHSSQKVVVDNEQECRVAIHVVPNYELTQQILKHGATVTVLEPRWLVKEIKEILKRSNELFFMLFAVILKTVIIMKRVLNSG